MTGANDFLSLLIVPNAAKPTTIRIKNPRLRAYTDKELEQAKKKIETEQREARLNRDVDIYLKKGLSV